MERDGAYDPKGRYQCEAEAAEVAREVRAMLDRLGLPYGVVRRERAAARLIAEAVMGRLRADDAS